jgi:hypothetical protein
LDTIKGDVAVGTTTVQFRPRARAECTAASPALPPLEAKMCGVEPGGSSERRRRM